MAASGKIAWAIFLALLGVNGIDISNVHDVYEENEPSLNFLAIGDWGSDPNSTDEIAVARGMGIVGKELNVDFVTLLGDNFYSAGIHGDEYSPRFQETFESVFSAESLQDIPFYAIAGNHDHMGNVSAQIEYTKHSTRWTYPQPWYSVKKTFGTGEAERTLEILFIDTVIFAGESEGENGEQLQGDEYPGALDAQLAGTQFKWLSDSMKHSTADYLLVAGHYPVYSIGQHGPTLLLKLLLKPLLERYGAHYLCGHDHDLEHIEEPGSTTQYFLSGAGGAGCCYNAKNEKKVPEGSIKFAAVGPKGSSYQKMPFPLLGGFVSLRFGQETFKAVYHAHNSTEIYSTVDIPRRNIATIKETSS
uniref:acid phosphatase n=1 Tax=Norrisiella sphaerica TaxID=552664 RepID=A0A7S2QSF6_9EUKA